MPTFSSALLPNTSGLTLGSSSLRWQPYLTNPDITGTITYAGPLSGITTFSTSGSITTAAQFISTVATGTAPLVVSSTTAIANLNASLLLGSTWAIPPAIGTTTPAAATFTTLTSLTEVHTGQAAPSVSGASTGRIYFDSTANRYLLSENAGAYRYFGGPYLNQQGSLTGVVPNGAETTLYSYSMPANTMLAGKGIRLTAYWQKTAGAGLTTYKAYLDGSSSSFQTLGPDQATDTGLSYAIWEIFNNSGVQNAQTITNRTAIYPTTGIAAPVLQTDTKNTASALTVKLTANVAAGTTITPKFWLVELIG